MKHYRLRWEIDIWADSPEQAAKEAREIQLDFESESTFDVREVIGGKAFVKPVRITVREEV